MKDEDKTKGQLIGELAGLRQRVAELEQRERMEEILRESEEKYRALVENANEAVIVVQDGMLRFVNARTMELTGYSEEELTSMPFAEFIHPDDREMTVERYLRRIEGEEIPHVYSFRIIDRYRNVKWAESNAVLITWEGRPATLTFLNDITERKRSEEELRRHRIHLEELVKERTAELTRANEELRREVAERKHVEEELRGSQEKSRAQYKGIPVPTYAWQRAGEDFALVDYNDAAVAITQGNVANFLGIKASEMYRDEPEIREELSRCFAERTSIERDMLYWFKGTGESKYLAVKYAFVPPDLVLVHTEDITERKRMEEELREHRDQLEGLVEERTAELKAINQQLQQEIADRESLEEQLRSLASELSLAEERERRHIAVELHDHIGQDLAICEIKLGELREMAFSADTAAVIDEVRKLIDHTIQNTRSLTFELSSPILYELGLEAAMEDLAEQLQEKHGIIAEFRDDGQSKPLDDDLRVFLFQAVRELLVNVVKHAQANSVKVSIRRHDGQVRISVEDDGIGFDTSLFDSRLYRSSRFGLFSIRERLNHLGGHLKVTSEPGHGTVVTLETPLKLKDGGEAE